MLSILPLRAQNASNFRKEVSKKDGSDKAGNIGSLNDQTPRSVGIEGGKIQDNIKVNYVLLI